MNSDSALPERLKAGDPGLGAPDSQEIEQRAVELAKSDGRSTFTDADLARAEAELGGGSPEELAPEADAPIVEDIQTWDEPVNEHGQKAQEFALEDEANVGEELVADGLDEADHSQRAAAAEEDDSR